MQYRSVDSDRMGLGDSSLDKLELWRFARRPLYHPRRIMVEATAFGRIRAKGSRTTYMKLKIQHSQLGKDVFCTSIVTTQEIYVTHKNTKKIRTVA